MKENKVKNGKIKLKKLKNEQNMKEKSFFQFI